MSQRPGYLLSLCLSSLAVAISLTTLPALNTLVGQNQMVAQANPCAGKPCAGKPCAGKSKATAGGPLASKLQGKPVVVDIYASWCPACTNVAPTLAQLKRTYAGKANFVVLDVTNQSTTRNAMAMAKELGLEKFFKNNKSQTGLIAIIDPATGKILAQHRNNPTASDYTSVLDKAIAQR